MNFIKFMFLFIKNNFMQLWRKWLSLPLVLLFPIITISLVAIIVVSFFSSEDHDPIKVGIVDLDQSEETQLVVKLISNTSQLGNYIDLTEMTEEKAMQAIEANEISTYIELPQKFTTNLYRGTPVTIPIKGNINQATESRLIKELIDSVARHIRTSQANILTINYYAKALGMDDAARSELLLEQFKNFLFYTIGKDKTLTQEEITNLTTASPVQYFGIAGWFLTITIWLFVIYNFLYKEEAVRLKKRMKLYGVTELQQVLARMIVTLVVTAIFAILSFLILNHFFTFEIESINYLRIGIIMLLYSLSVLNTLAILEIILPTIKSRLLLQIIVLGLLLVLSGSFIPSLYFPLKIQAFMPYIFSSEAYHWISEIMLNGRFYADYIPLLLMSVVGLFIFIGLSLGKERIQQ